MFSSSQEELAERNKNLGMYSLAFAIGMVGMSYAAVPLYQMFCQAYGYGGTTQKDSKLDKLKDWKAEEGGEQEQREIEVSFTATTNYNMPWDFEPTQQRIKVVVGETALAFYTAKNNDEKPVVGVATYNVMPDRAGLYFNKIQCFCFDEQRLRAGEQVDMPVFFFLDPEWLKDPKMRNIKEICLSYTFFPSSEWEDGEEDDDEEDEDSAPLVISAAPAVSK